MYRPSLGCRRVYFGYRQLLNSRYTESGAAYREVQERHEDIKRIAKTLDELAQLFNDVCYSRSGCSTVAERYSR